MGKKTVLYAITWVIFLNALKLDGQHKIQTPLPPAGCAVDRLSKTAGQSDQLIDQAQLETAIHLSADYLQKRCDENGKFEYLVSTNPKTAHNTEYNILRHAGTVYALAMFRRWCFEEDGDQAIIRAAKYLLRETLVPVRGGDDLLAVGSFPCISDRKQPFVAKLGGTGLGLVALLSVENIQPGTVSIDTLRKLGRFLLFMQKKDGSFYSHYIPAKGGKVNLSGSVYYSGEAVLGLLMLYERDSSPQWINSAVNGLTYLARSRSGEPDIQIDHWFLLAAARLLAVHDFDEEPESRELIFQHVVRICEDILSQSHPCPRHSAEYGCLTGDGRTCPTAARLEGLLAALTLLKGDQEQLREAMVSAVHRGVDFLLRAQVHSGKNIGGIPWSIRPQSAAHKHFNRSYIERTTEIRIDYVQHALSALIQYDQVFYR